MTAHTQLLVYNSENRFVGFFYQFTCRVERTKGLKDKTEFWDRLVTMSICKYFFCEQILERKRRFVGHIVPKIIS